MSKAFVLINCELGSENQVISDLQTIDCVKHVYGVFGAYDILIISECDQLEELRQMIIGKIRKIDNIRSTITLMSHKFCYDLFFISFYFKITLKPVIITS